MFDSILVPLDRSKLAECVLPHAVAFARALDAQMTLVHVTPMPEMSDRLTAMDPLEWRIRRAEAETYMQNLKTQLEAVGVDVDTEILDGPAADQIVGFVHERRFGLLIMSSHGQSGLSGWGMSSVVQEVLQRAYTSILLVRAYQPATPDLLGQRYRRLLVPLDGSQRAENVLPLVADLARIQEAQVLVAHVVERPEMPRRTPMTLEDSDLAERLVERNRAEAVRYLQEVRGRLGDIDVETRLLIGEQVEIVLHELADQEEMDLILLNAHGYSGGTIWPYGAVVINFLFYGSSPLLVVQDLRREQARPTRAELAMQQIGRR